PLAGARRMRPAARPLTFRAGGLSARGRSASIAKKQKSERWMAEKEPPGEEDTQQRSFDPLIIGVGASAGAAGSIERLFSNLKLESDQVLVLALQHREALDEGRLRIGLQRLDGVRLVEAADGMSIDGRTIYLCPANMITVINGERFAVRHAQQAA